MYTRDRLHLNSRRAGIIPNEIKRIEKDRHTHIINNKSIYTATLLQVTAQKRSYKVKTSKNAKGKDIKCIIYIFFIKKKPRLEA